MGEIGLPRECGDRLARFPPVGEIPCVWKSGALVWLHGLDRAVAAFEKDALVRAAFVDEREAVALRTQARVALDEIAFAEAEVLRDACDLGLTDFYEARPAAAVCAALAFVVDRVSGRGQGWREK